MQPKAKGIIISLVTVIVVLVSIFLILKWGFSDTEFRHGDLNYWLLTDDEIRNFPIVGAKLSDVIYISKVLDGTSPAAMIIIYKSKKDVNDLVGFYKKYISKSDYSIIEIVKKDKKYYIDLDGGEKYPDIGIYIKYEKNGTYVRAEFIEY